MIDRRELSDRELAALLHDCTLRKNEDAAYTDLWLTKDGKTLIKLFRDDARGGENAYDVESDVMTLCSLSGSARVFGKRFVLPDTIYTQHNVVIGYSMPFIDGVSLSKAEGLSMHDFKRIMHQVYSDLLFVNNKTRYSFADLHEDNIIVGSDGDIYHIDLDGWYCGNGHGRRSRYLYLQRNLLLSCGEKYRFTERGNVLPDINSDLFCLVHVVLNHLLQSAVCFADLPGVTQAEYLNYLAGQSGAAGVVRMYENLLSNEANRFDVNAVNALPDDIGPFSLDSFKKKTARFHSAGDAEDFLLRNEARLNTIFPDRKLVFDSD